MKAMRVRALVATLVGVLAMAPSASAFNMANAKSVEKQCKAMSNCNKGGVNPPVTCNIGTEKCPPCVTFNNNGCFELVGGTCPFGEDCTNAWNSEGGGGSATGSSGSHKDSTGTQGSHGNSGGNSPSAGVASNSSSANSTSSKSGDASSTSKPKDGGTDMTVVFGIVGAAIGVIAVAVIFLALVRRSRAAEEDDDEMAPTPPSKSAAAGPSTTTNATSYAPYAQRAPANPTTPTNRVIKYYNDNAQPSPHGGRGGGGFGSQQAQQQPPVKTVRPAAAANAPTFFNQKPNPPMATMAQPPVQTSAYQEQNYYNAPPAAAPAPPAPTYQEHNYHQAQMTAAPTTIPQAEPLFTVHTGPDEPQVVRRVSSPRPRRESYEF